MTIRKTAIAALSIAVAIVLIATAVVWASYREREPEPFAVLSTCEVDLDGDGALETLSIRTGADGGNVPEPGAPLCGASFEVARGGAVLYSTDMADLRPYKVQVGDVDGDGAPEISISMYKTTKFHPVMARRPFFYRFEDGRLVPLWLGSRLSRPFTDYVLRDLDGDGRAELISIETLSGGGECVALYRWSEFGFELAAQSDALDAGLTFAKNSPLRLIVNHSRTYYELTLNERGDALILEPTDYRKIVED